MAVSIRDFYIGLYQEYLEEASFLYEQRLTLFGDPEITWKDIHDFEERFEAHIDGLVVGEALALEVCKKQAKEGDLGELHAAVRVFCRQNRQDLVLGVLAELDPEAPERIQAISDALKHEFPDAWQDTFLRMLAQGDQKVLPILATLFGYRRLQAGTDLAQHLRAIPADSLPRVIWALGRLREQGSRVSLLTYLQHEDASVCSAAALALLRLGDQQTTNHCLQQARSRRWPFIPLGLGGNRSVVNFLLELAGTGKAEADRLIALGLLGDISAIPILFTQLAYADVAESAALALQLITGAQLYEEAFVPDEIDEDELFEEEREKLQQGQIPTRPDGRPFGTTITRLSLKPEDWQKWWTENRRRFDPNIRYRHGKPYSPACLLETLESEHSRHQVRQLAYEELVIRYSVDFPFETDMFVTQQKQALAQYADWIKANSNRFREGEWYFSGQLIPL
jgi:uncharacterized protein (TIGR02270 family)